MKPKNQNRFLSTARLCLPLASAITVLFSAQSVHAVSNSWAANADGSWATAASWTGSANIPGSTTADNADVATFNNLLTVARVVTVDTTRFIGGITFGATNTSITGYTLQTGTLRLNSGSVIQTTGAIGANTNTISSPIRISGTTTAAASFNSTPTTVANGRISVTGTVTGSDTAATATTLTLTGTGTGANGVGGIIQNGTGGTLALSKTGTGTWALSGANTYSGGTTLSAGTLAISNNTSFGSGNVLVTGTSRINIDATVSSTNAINVGAGLTLQLPQTAATSRTATFSGQLTGSSSITLQATGFNGANGTLAFTAANNTFTGNVLLPIGTSASTPTASGNDTFSFNSIGDGGNFTFQKTGHTNTVIYTGTSNITFGTRQINIGTSFGNSADGIFDGSGTTPINNFQNNSTANTVTFNSNMGMTTILLNGYFFFGGSNTGNNTFAGTIGNPTSGGNLGIGKWGAGKWILTGSNSYLGNVIVTQGTLSVSTITASASNQPLGKGSLITLGHQNNSGTLEFTGSSNSSVDRRVQMGNQNSNVANAGGGTILNNGTGSLTFTNSIFNPTVTTVTATRTLTLGGSFSGSNAIQGIIQDNVANTGKVALTASGGTWVLSGANTFSGNVSVTGGTLVGSSTNAFGTTVNTRTITVNSGANLRFDAGNVLSGTFSSTSVPSLAITGTVTNNFANNNALNNVTLTGATLTATAGSANYGAFNINGTVTSTGTSTISSSEPVNGRMMLSNVAPNGTIFDVTGGTLTISAPLAAVTREGHLGYLTKNGVGTLQLNGANTYSGGTILNAGTTTVGTAGTLGSGTAALAVNGATTILNLSTALDTAVGSLSGTAAATLNNGGTGRNFTVNQTTAGSFAGVIAGSGNFTLGSLSTNTLTLAGPQTYSGSTTVNGGTLRLAYSAGTSKLSNTATLSFGGGTVELSDGGTPHTEEVLSTSLTAGTNSRVTRTAGTSVLQMNTITAGAGATIDFAADGIASTDNPNDPTTGLLGNWATVGGTNWAVNSTGLADGPIIAYTGYTDVARQTAGIIADGPASNVRIIEGTGSNSITLGSSTTAINSLNQSIVGGTGDATINSVGQTLLSNAILVSSGAGFLTIGNGTLAAAIANGDLSLINNSTNGLTIDSVIADNLTSSLSKSGTGPLSLSAVNTYAGATSIAGGTVTLSGSLTGGGAITVGTNAALTETSTGVISGASSLTLASTGTSTLSGTNTHTGGTTLSAGSLILGNTSALGAGPFTVNGGSFNTDGVITSLAGNYPQNWNGSFTFGGASALDLGTSTVTLLANSQVTVAANTLTVGGVISGAFSLAKAGTGTLVLNGANDYSGGTTITGFSDSGTLVLGNTSALGTGPLTINGNAGNKIDSSVPNLVNANNNAQNWQASFTFVGTESLDLGTGPVTMLGNRTVTVAANTLTIGGAISGPGFGLTKSGAGTMVLNANNTFTGTTTLSAGTLILGNVNALGTGTLTLSGGNLDTSVVGFVNAKNNAQTWNGSFTVVGTNNLNLGTGAVTLGASPVVTVSANTLTVGGISGGFGLTKAGAGNMTITGVSSYTGGTTINDNSGTLDFNGAGSVGTYAGAVAIGTGSTLRFSSNVANNQTLSGAITGLGALVMAPSVTGATLNLTNAANTYNGATTISGGRIAAGPTNLSANTTFGITGNSTSGGQLYLNATGTVPNNFSLAGVGFTDSGPVNAGAIRFTSGNILTGTITLTGNSRVGFINGTGTATLSGRITGSNAIEFYGAASANASTHTFTLANVGTANDYTGDTIISSVDFNGAKTGALAVLSLGANNQIPDGSSAGIVVFNGADANHISVLDLNGFSETINGVSNVAAAGAIIRNNVTGVSVLSIGANDTTSSFSGLISNTTGTLAITKIGAGTLTLSNANTFVGATTISAGTLSLTNSLALQNSPVNTLGSIAGDATNGLKTSVTTLQFGGLNGNKNLADIFTTTSGGFSGVTALTLRPGNAADSHVYTGVISDGAAGMTLSKTGAGAQTLSASNTYTGATTIAAGSALVVGANDALGTTAAGTTVAVNASLGFTGGVNYTTTESVSGAGAGTAGASGPVASGTRGFIQGVSGSSTFAGNIELNANGTSRIGSQDGASLTLTGAITQASGITTANILFRVGSLPGDFVTLSNAGNSFGGDSTVFTGTANTGYAGVRLGINNALPTSLSIAHFGTTNATFTALDLAGFNQSLNGLATGSGSGALQIINLNTVTPSILTLNPTVDKATTSHLILGGGGLGVINLVKDGSFTQTLSGASTYTGTTTVNAGTLTLGNAAALGTSAATVAGGSLNLNGQIIANTVSVGALGTLTGTGNTGAATLAGSMTPGGTGNGLITMTSATVAATSAIALQLPATGTRGTNYDAITVSSALVLDGTITVSITGLVPANGQTFDLIDSTGAIDVTNFNVATDLVLPALAGGLSWDTSAFASSGVVTIVSDPYIGWAASKGLTGGNNAKNADPDGDGKNNLYEFAFDGDPLSGANDGKIVGKIGTVGGNQVMTLTLPVRNTATFTANSGDQVSALIDGLYYKIEGDVDLGTFANTISEVTGGDATTIQTGLPSLSSGWTYRTFRDAGTVPTVPKVFLRAKISDTP